MLRRNRSLLYLFLIILLGALLRFFMIGAKTVWLDEAFSVWVSSHTLQELVGWLLQIDQHPPLYYTLLSFWIQLFGDLQGAVRSLSALCGVLTIPFFYATARRLVDEPTALIAALILAVSPFNIQFAQEGRMYGLLALAVSAALFFAVYMLTDDSATDGKLRWWPRIGLAISQAAVMLTHNTAVVYFLVALNLPILLILLYHNIFRKSSSLVAVNHPRFVQSWVWTQVLALLLWSPWSIAFVYQSVGVDQEFWLWPPTAKMVSDTIKNFNFSFFPDWFPAQPFWLWLYPFLALLGAFKIRRSPAKILLLLSLFLLPIAIALLVSLRRPIYYDRTMIWATLPYYLLIAAGIRWLGELTWRKVKADEPPQNLAVAGQPTHPQPTNQQPNQWLSYTVQSFCVATILFLSGLSLNGYYFWFQKEGWDQAADYVSQNIGQGDVILFNATWVQIPFDYYYRHHNLDTELRGVPTDLFDRGVLEPKMTEADIPYLRSLVEGRQRVWLVYSHDWYTDPTQIIPTELNQLMQQSHQQEFSGLQIMQFEAR